MTDLQLHAALGFVVLQPVHELGLVQVLAVELLPFCDQGLVASAVLLKVGHYLIPLFHQTLSLIALQVQLEGRQNREGNYNQKNEESDRGVRSGLDLISFCSPQHY